MGYDGFATTHPVVQPIRTVSETNQAFDAISYSKGEAVIAMLEAYAGEDAWRDGIRSYIQRHRYGNTTSDDLWRAVEEAGAAGLVEIAHDFTLQPGVPLVRAEAECRDGNDPAQPDAKRVQPRPQGRRSPPARSAGACRCWSRPARGAPLRRVLEGSADAQRCRAAARWSSTAASSAISARSTRPAMARALAEALPSLEPIDQLGLLRDNFALAEAGYQPIGPALDMLAAVPRRCQSGRRARRGGALGARSTAIATEATRPRVAALARERWLPRLRQLGFDPKPGESLVDTDLRGDLHHRARQHGRRDRRRRGAPPLRRARKRPQGARRAAQDHLAGDRRAQRRRRPNGTGSPRWPRTAPTAAERQAYLRAARRR